MAERISLERLALLQWRPGRAGRPELRRLEALVQIEPDEALGAQGRRGAGTFFSADETAWLAANGLTLHPSKTKIVDARTDGFDFLGYTFRGSLRLPRKKSLAKVKETIRAKTKRTNGNSLTWIVGTLNATLQGWFGYFRHCHWNVYTTLDSWTRGRLRSILRKRAGRQGRGRGADHQRWPNEYFADRGLYSLQRAHGRLHQSLTG